MSEIVGGMIDDVLYSIKTEKLEGINEIQNRDDTVDHIRYSIFRKCLTYMMEDPKKITRCTDHILISRYLERCGDHARKIAVKVHYMVTGERIEIALVSEVAFFG